jgi:protein tyrosine phosphatase (PTP) superfamily phosphohydrolase (DUF442 family)
MTPFEAIRGVPNACQALPKVVTGGQPDKGHLEALARAGVKVVLDLRAPHEPRLLDEVDTVRRLGMEYVNIPVITNGVLDDALMDRLLAEFRRHADTPMLCHCAGGNRVGGALIPYLVLDQEFSEEDAIATARRVGLSSPELLTWGVEYARRKGGR